MTCHGLCKHCDIKGCYFRSDEPIEIDNVLEAIIKGIENED